MLRKFTILIVSLVVFGWVITTPVLAGTIEGKVKVKGLRSPKNI